MRVTSVLRRLSGQICIRRTIDLQLDTAGLHVLLPLLVELGLFGENDHGW